MALFPFHCLTFTFSHFLGKSLFAMLTDVADTSWTIRSENKGEYLSYEIGIYLTLSYILVTFGTRMEILTLDARPYFAPSRLFIIMATRAILQ